MVISYNKRNFLVRKKQRKTGRRTAEKTFVCMHLMSMEMHTHTHTRALAYTFKTILVFANCVAVVTGYTYIHTYKRGRVESSHMVVATSATERMRNPVNSAG